MVCKFQLTEIYFQTWISVWFVAILSNLKINFFCEIKLIFTMNKFETTQSLYLSEKKSEK